MLASCLLLMALQASAVSWPEHVDADAQRVERLEGLCRLWGTIKFFHPWLAYRDIDWDRALIDAIPRVDAAQNPEQYRGAIAALLGALGDPLTRVSEPDSVESRPPEQLGVTAALPTAEMRDADAVAVIDATDWAAIAASNVGPWGGALTRAFKQSSKAQAVIVDLRRKAPWPASELDMDAYVFGGAARVDLRAFLETDLVLPATRTRMHSGYAPCVGDTSGGYFAGFQVSDPARWIAKPGKLVGKSLVLITNAGSRGLTPVLVALQDAGLATIVHEGSDRSCFDEGSTFDVQLVDGVTARVRVVELLRTNGATEWGPSVSVNPEPGRDVAMERALAIVRAGGRPTAASAALAPSVRASPTEKPYPDMPAPAREYRLLALFRVWNVLHHFFPYKHLMDRSWNDALREFIPRFEAADDAVAYGTALFELTALLGDSHVHVYNGAASAADEALFGNYGPPIVLNSWSSEPVVTTVLDPALESAGRVRRGDRVVSVAGKSVAEQRAALSKYLSASTPQALAWTADSYLLCGAKGTSVDVELRAPDGALRKVELTRSSEFDQLLEARNASRFHHPKFTVLASGFGYFDLVELQPHELDAAFDAVASTPALILDMRGYPKGTAWEICARLTDKRFDMATFHRPYWITPDPSQHVDYSFGQPIEPSTKPRYANPIVVLIDNNAVSQSEHSCLGFEGAAAGHITFVGTPTMGTNGDVTNVVLPGGVTVSFSGHDVRHADGRQLQRVGIQPDIRVEPTIAGILADRDEVLDRAIEFLNKPK